jgi:DNA-binding NtrC family response regulator
MPARVQKNILVVDSDPYYCSLMIAALRSAGYCVSACNETEALITIKTSVFDLVLLDMGMFCMSAIQLLTAIRQKETSIPVFTVADPADKMFVIDLLRNGYTNFLENYMCVPQEARKQLD